MRNWKFLQETKWKQKFSDDSTSEKEVGNFLKTVTRVCSGKKT